MIKIEQILKQEEVSSDVKKQVVLYKGEAYTYFDSGLTRHVFVNKEKTKVIKFLIEKDMKDYNFEEADIYKTSSKKIRKEMASTKLECNGMVIEQEYCNPVKMDNRKMTMAQILFASSCRNEVGWTNDGRLVCFDLDEYKKY